MNQFRSWASFIASSPSGQVSHTFIKSSCHRRRKGGAVEYHTERIVMNRTSRKYRKAFLVTVSNMRHAQAVYNTALFHMRNLFTGLRKDEGARTENEREVIGNVTAAITVINDKRAGKDKAPWSFPSPEQPYLSLYQWMTVMTRILKKSLPRPETFYSKLEQQVVLAAGRNMKSFVSAMKDYGIHPEKYHGRPKLPGYLKSGTFTLTYDCQMVTCGGDGRHRWLEPKGTGVRIPTGRKEYSGIADIKLRWQCGRIIASVCMKEGGENSAPEGKTSAAAGTGSACIPECGIHFRAVRGLDYDRMLGIDPGIGNFMTVVPGFGENPFIIRGGKLKSVNQYYNKRHAEIRGRLKKDLNRDTCRRLDRIIALREDYIYNYFHQAAALIVNYALQERAGTIVIGRNTGWKQESGLGRTGNQNFVMIPHARFIRMLKDRAEREGIRVILQEESYTSRASSLDRDRIPVYGKERYGEDPAVFSGKRIHRGLYVSGKGIRINADVNGAANILRKYKETALQADTAYLYRTVEMKNAA